MFDITDRNAAEEALREAFERERTARRHACARSTT